MNAIKTKFSEYYLEVQYFKKTFNNLIHRNTGGYVENARERLMRYSPKPSGYYKGAYNRTTDEAIDLSIIVPVYNVEKYLSECLDSIVNQKTSYSYEVVCIDDGSPDRSIDILRRYEKQYPVIRVFRQENRGFSGARNRGLDEAVGKYVMFVDSDDRLGNDAIQTMMVAAEGSKYDIVSSGFCMLNGIGVKKEFLEAEYETTENGYNGVSHHQCYFWGKVYKRSFWRNIRLAEGYLFEDMQVLHIFSRLCVGYKYIAKPLYEYRWNQSGISSTAPANPKSVDQYWMIEFCEEEFDRLGIETTPDVFRGLMKELGPYLYSRTSRLPMEIRKTVFSAAADKVNHWMLSDNVMKTTEKRLLKAFQAHDFYQWETASSTWH